MVVPGECHGTKYFRTLHGCFRAKLFCLVCFEYASVRESICEGCSQSYDGRFQCLLIPPMMMDCTHDYTLVFATLSLRSRSLRRVQVRSSDAELSRWNSLVWNCETFVGLICGMVSQGAHTFLSRVARQ